MQWGERMSSAKMTTAEATKLIEMAKRALVAEINFPSRGTSKSFDVVGDTKADLFTVNIFRGRIPHTKCNFGARIKKNNVMLLELHISPTQVHVNPNGEKITGSHWHIYSEEYGRSQAFPATDISEESFVENTLSFLRKFNVVEPPDVTFQLEII